MTFDYKPPKNFLTYLLFLVLTFIVSAVFVLLGAIIIEIIWFLFVLAAFPNNVQEQAKYTLWWFNGEAIVYYAQISALSIVVIVLVSFILTLLNLMNFGARKTTWFYVKLAHSRIGSLLSLTPLFNFSGEWVEEKVASETIDLSSPKAILSEIMDRKSDILFLPVLITIFFVVTSVSIIPPTLLKFSEENFLRYTTPAIACVVLIILCFFTPAILVLTDSEIKLVGCGEENDVDSVQNLASIIKSGITFFVGFSAVLGFGDVSLSTIPPTLQKEFNINVGSTFALDSSLKYILTFIYAAGYFLILLGLMLPGIGVMYLRYFKYHQKNIIELRQKLLDKKICINAAVTIDRDETEVDEKRGKQSKK